MACNLREKAVYCSDSAQRVYDGVSSEVYGGEWTDSVGESYLAYAQNITRFTQSLMDMCTQLDNTAKNLNQFDVEKDRAYISSLAAEVR